MITDTWILALYMLACKWGHRH